MCAASIRTGSYGLDARDRTGGGFRRSVARLFERLRPASPDAMLGLTEHQLRDIGAEPAVISRAAEFRAVNSFRGPEGRTWALLMYRGPAS